MIESYFIPLNSLTNDKKDKKRVGRGVGSGKGRQCGAGHKGQCARSGVSIKRQLAKFIRKLPKRGFKSRTKKLEEISIDLLIRKYDASSLIDLTGYKLIGKAVLEEAFKVKVSSITDGAKSSITSAGGSVEII